MSTSNLFSKKRTLLLMLGAGALLVGGIYLNKEDDAQTAEVVMEKPQPMLNTELNSDDMKEAVDSILEALLSLHYVSLQDIEYSDADSFILEELTESLNDKAKLENINYKTQSLLDSPNQIVAVTGLALNTTAWRLTAAYDTWINYLKGVDVNTLNVAEFQYQLASFQSETHQAYLDLVEGVSMFPGITIVFSENEENTNTVNVEVRDYLLQRLDELFADVLADNDRFYAETGNRYAIAIAITSYREFLVGSQ